MLRSLGVFSAAVPAYSGEHETANVCFEKIMGLRQRIIQAGTFLEFRSVHRILAEQHLGGAAALSAQRINFENELGRPANGQLHVVWFLQFLHGQRFARLAFLRYSGMG